MKQNLKQLLGSLSALALTAGATISTIACVEKKKSVNDQLSEAIINALNNDTSVFYENGPSKDVVEKIKLVVKHTPILSEENYKLSEAKVLFKKDGQTEAFTGSLELEKKYNFNVEINHQTNDEKLKKIINGSVTVKANEQAIQTKEILDKFDINNIDNFTSLGDLLVDSNINKIEVIKRIQDGVKNQWFNFVDQSIEITTVDNNLKVAEDKKLAHPIKFKLIDKVGVSSKEFEIKFNYIIRKPSNDLSDLKEDFIKKEFTVNATNEGNILLADVKLVLEPAILQAIKDLTNNIKITENDYNVKYYKDKITETELESSFKLANNVKWIFVKVESKAESKNLISKKNQILKIKIAINIIN